MTPRFLAHLSDIASDYDALLCDAWGVIHDGVRVFAGVDEALTRFRATRGPVIVLTNAPRPNDIIPPQLDRLGLSRGAYDGVVTSGDATRASILTFLPKPAYKLGPDKDEALYRGIDVSFAPLEQAEFIICTGLVDDAHETPDDYSDLLSRAAALGLTMICANPDMVVRWAGRLVYCAGALAQTYERLGGAVIYGGKPHEPIYRLALARLSETAGREIDAGRALVIGDGAATDIAGANAHGFDALYVAHESGVHEGAIDGAAVSAALGAAGAHARFWTTALRW